MSVTSARSRHVEKLIAKLDAAEEAKELVKAHMPGATARQVVHQLEALAVHLRGELRRVPVDPRPERTKERRKAIVLLDAVLDTIHEWGPVERGRELAKALGITEHAVRRARREHPAARQAKTNSHAVVAALQLFPGRMGAFAKLTVCKKQ